ncbi:MAG TPA: prephenate dehydratase [Acidimicrobiales bacterium]|nr:prephenate dehydratase [Acidimicrobiales bacterium]
MPRIGFLGPLGTFTEQALLTQADLAAAELVPLASIPDVLAATSDGEVDLGFVPIENSIEGSVNITLDALTFDADLLLQREVVINVVMNLLVPPGVTLEQVERIVSIPVATAQCRRWLQAHLPDAEHVPANSTAEAARLVGEERDGRSAAIAPALAGELYGLTALGTDIEDHPENQTRFVVVARSGVPAPTGHDKTTIVCFQHADRPGSLLGILQEFSARAINLTYLSSRPTKRSLGEYCFFIDLEGHLADEVVADCLRELKAKLADVKFLGSYPAAGDQGDAVRRDVVASWRAADEWLRAIRADVVPGEG